MTTSHLTDQAGRGNSPCSVWRINAGRVPWLRSLHDPDQVIPAGRMFEEFKAKIRAFGGEVYVEEP